MIKITIEITEPLDSYGNELLEQAKRSLKELQTQAQGRIQLDIKRKDDLPPYRMLDPDEQGEQFGSTDLLHEIEMFYAEEWIPYNHGCDPYGQTQYRTRLTREELRKARGL